MGTRQIRFLTGALLTGLMLCLAGSAGAATYTNGVLTDAVQGFQVRVPSSWARNAMSNQDSSTHLFVSPDQNVAVGVTTYPGAGSAELGRVLSRFRQAAFAGAQQLAEETTTLNGLSGLLQVYRQQDPKGPVIVGAFAVKGNGRGYVVWHMIPEAQYNQRFPESDAVMNTFALTGPSAPAQPHPSKPDQTPSSPRRQPPAHAAPSPKVHPPSSAPPSLPAGDFVRYRDPEAGLQFDLPSGWTESHPQPHILSIRGKGDRVYMTVNYQVLDRRNPKYTNLDVASEDLYAQLPGLGTHRIVNDTRVTIQGMPAHILDVIIDPGDREYAVRYIEIERPEYIALMSLICPEDQREAFAPVAERVRLTIAPYTP